MPVSCPKCTTPVPTGAKFCATCGSPASPMSPLSPGVGGGGPAPGLPARYEVIKFLGRGGMGRVYLCRDTDLDVEVAIKVLPAEVAADEEALQQIQKEARAAAKFRECPGILSLYGFESYGDTRYLVMEFAAGGSLHDRLKKEGRIPEADCRRLGAEVADALAFAHRQKVLHRDIKPANVLLNAEGRAKVADFGIAKVMADTSARMSLMTMVGTPIYMAPEIVLQKRVDHRADLYSLGCMLFEMSTGERPFQGAYHEVMAAKMTPGALAPKPRERNPDLSEDFAACVRRLLAPEAEERFPDAAACAAALRGVVATPVSSATSIPDLTAAEPPPAGTRLPGPTVPHSPTVAVPRPKRSKAPILAGLAVLVAGAALAVWLATRPGEETPPAKPPGSPTGGAVPATGKPPGESPRERPKEGPKAGPPAAPPRPAPGLAVFTDPPGAAVTVDGTERGVAGAEGLLLADLDPTVDHLVKAWLDEYSPAEQRGVRWTPGDRREVRLTLPRQTGFLRIEGGPPGAAVRLERQGAPAKDLNLAEDGSLGPVPVEVGDWTATVSLKGYEPRSLPVKVTAGRSAKVEAGLKERDGTVALTTDPPGAEVYEGETLLGTTPLRPRTMPPGKHALRLVHPDRDEATKDVVVRGEENLDLGTIPLPDLATLDLAGLAPGERAEVYGIAASGILRRRSGEVEVTFSKAKHRDQVQRVTLRSGETSAPRPGAWQALSGRLDLSALPQDAAVTVDGKAVDRSQGTVEVEAGSRVVALSRRGHGLVPAQTVEVGPDATVAVANPAWVALVGRLDLRDLPADVAVTVDGAAVDRSRGIVEVAAGTHALGLSRKGDRPGADQNVTVGGDETTRVRDPGWVALVTVTPAVPGLPPPPESVLAAQSALAALPEGFVRTEDGRIFCEKDGAEMVLVPAGEFVMGATSGDSETRDDENPSHRVFVSAFLMDRHEITNGQFAKFVQATGYRTDAEKEGKGIAVVGDSWSEVEHADWQNPKGPSCTIQDGKFVVPLNGIQGMDAHPVVLVSWNDAKAYCDWAGRRLPTEAECEKCLRGGAAGQKYPWGNSIPPRGRPGNYADATAKRAHSGWSEVEGYDDSYERTSPAGSFEQNGLGLFDITGNAWEWCSDWYDGNYYGTLGGGVTRDPQGPPSGSVRVLRGGGWVSRPFDLRCAFRVVDGPSFRNVVIGCRAARGLP